MKTKHCYNVGDLVWFDSIPFYVSKVDRLQWSRQGELMFDTSTVHFTPHPLFDDETPRRLVWDNMKGGMKS